MPFFRQFIAFLMIAVCFNTAIGVPLHAAEHLKASRVVTQALVEARTDAQTEVDAQSSVVASRGALPEGKSDASAESCAVCAAYSQSVADFVIWPAAPPGAQTCSLVSAFDAPPPGAAVQWPYSARDPPRA